MISPIMRPLGASLQKSDLNILFNIQVWIPIAGYNGSRGVGFVSINPETAIPTTHTLLLKDSNGIIGVLSCDKALRDFITSINEKCLNAFFHVPGQFIII